MSKPNYHTIKEGASKLELSIYDSTVIWNGSSASQVYKESLDMAVAAEQLGYKRYWFTESHNTSSHASSSPEMLVAQIAAYTTDMNVGMGNLMLPHQSALKVVENVRTLEGVYPGRIDMGLHLSVGEDVLAAEALHRTHEVISEEEYLDQLVDLIAYMTDTYSTSRGSILASPKVTSTPGVWIHGTNQGAQYATEYGLGLVIEHQFSPHAIEVLQAYRKYYKPSALREQPHSILIVPILCTDSNEASRIGSELRQLAERASVDEIMLLTEHSDVLVRKKSIELMAIEFNLSYSPTAEGVNHHV